jgi:hypothetical protein
MGGTVTGPASSTDTAIARWNGTSGTVIQDSTVTIDGSGNFSGVAALNNGATATTQSQGDNSTNIATTAYVDTGLSGLSLNSLSDVITDYPNDNMFLGQGGGAALTTGDGNTGLGLNSMAALTSGGNNTALGFASLQHLTTGNGNVALGAAAGVALTTGQGNVAVGDDALSNATTPEGNIAIGSEAGISLVTGDRNICIGETADAANGVTYSVAIGFQTTALSSNSVAVGTDAGIGSGITNATAIGYQANVTSSNTVQIGNSSVTAVYFGSSGTTLGTDLALAGNPTTTTQSSSDNSTKVATTAFVQTAVSAITAGLDSRPSCRVATTAALTATYSNGSSGVGATLTNSGTKAAISIDGVALSTNDRVLVKNQSTAAQNGIYTVTTVGSGSVNWVLTRATDFNTASAEGVVEGAFTVIEEGTTQFGTLWIETGEGPFTIGTTAITFTQLQVTNVNLTNGDILVGNASNIAAAVSMSGDVTITNAGVTSIKSSVALAGSPTTTTQTAGDNSTKIATTAFVTSAVSGGSVTAATQSDQETGTSTTTYVSPGRQQYHQSAAKFWIQLDGSDTTINASYNVTSSSHDGTGTGTVTIATDFSSSSWCCLTAAASTFGGAQLLTRAAGSMSWNTRTSAGALVNITDVDMAGFGDQ